MSEFKFTCPVCGQNILCDTVLEGTQHICPHCNNTIGVPKQFAEHTDVSTGTESQPVWPGYAATAASRQTSGMATASLVCSLSSFITCIGWLPGIICGHLAKSRIRRNPSLKGSGLATAGLAIGYLILMLEAGSATVWVWRFSSAVRQGYENARQDLATNNVIIAKTQSTTVSNGNEQRESVAPIATSNQQIKSEWTSDISHVSFPDSPARGKFHGKDFVVKSALFRNGNLRINSANGMSLDITHGLGESIESQSYDIQSAGDSGTKPHVKMTWNEGGVVQSATFSTGYGMELQVGQARNRTASAKIYLCFPDDSKSYIAGTFEVRLARTK